MSAFSQPIFCVQGCVFSSTKHKHNHLEGPPFRKLEHKHNHLEGGSLDEIATHGESEHQCGTPGADTIHKIHMVLRGWWNL